MQGVFDLAAFRKFSDLRTCRTSPLIWSTCVGKVRKMWARFIALNRPDCSLAVKVITGHWLIGVHAAWLSVPYNDY